MPSKLAVVGRSAEEEEEDEEEEESVEAAVEIGLAPVGELELWDCCKLAGELWDIGLALLRAGGRAGAGEAEGAGETEEGTTPADWPPRGEVACLSFVSESSRPAT